MNSTVGINRAIKSDLAIVLVLEACLVIGLHLTGGSSYSVPVGSLGDWLASADPVTALVAIARLGGLMIGYWLVVTTVLYALAHYSGWTSVTSLLEWVTLPVIKRVVHGVTAMSLTSASLLGPVGLVASPAFADEQALVATSDDDIDSTEDTTDQSDADGTTDPDSGYEPGAAGWPVPTNSSDFWRPRAEVRSQAATTHVVEKTDNFWAIAESHLRNTVGRSVTEDEISQYWVRVVEANRDSIRSGDPDLIFPDEQVALPPVFEE